MKFSYRFCSLLVFGATTMVTFFLWSKNLYFFDKDTPKSVVTVQNSLNAAQNQPAENIAKKYDAIRKASNQKESSKMSISHSKSIFISSDRVYNFTCGTTDFVPLAQTDLNTYDILHDIDSIYNRSWISDNDLGKELMFKKGILPKSNPIKEDDKLRVIVLPHSHSDPGWLKTIANYYEDQTRNTLNFMVEKLQKYPDMTFVWAESVFLSMWWKDLDKEGKEDVKKLIERNQLEIAVGSWVVPDEANPSLFGFVDQMIEGHQWLEHNLGIKPENTWSLDPFGYTSTLPYLYSKAGFENMIILRVHQFLKTYLQSSQNLEFYWRQHWDNKGNTDIFTTMLPYTLYNIKHQCGPDESVCLNFDFRKISNEYTEAVSSPVTDNNVEYLAKQLLKQYQMKNQLFRHNVVLIPIGDDFRYDRNVEWDQQYGNYSKLFQFMNAHAELNVEIGFGTLKDYFQAVHESIAKNDIDIPKLQGDFFPYTDRDEEYWTGYFTSRPFDKNMGREVEQHLRAAEILNVLAKVTGGLFKHYEGNVDLLSDARQQLGLFQHHDAITGTARTYVVIDYEQRLFSALSACQEVIRKSSQYLMARDKYSADNLEFETHQPKSMFQIRPTKSILEFKRGSSVIIVFNPTVQPREDVIRVSIDTDNVEVYDMEGNRVLSQINPLWMSSREIYRNAFELVFIATIPPLGLSRFQIKIVPKSETPSENFAAFLSFNNMESPKLDKDMRFKVIAPRSETVMLENDYLRARFSARSGLLQSITTKAKLATTNIFSETLMYKSRRSGAYIFEPTGPATDTEMYSTPGIKIIKGPVMSEIQFTQRDSVVTHIVRLYNCTGILGTVLEINNIANLTKFDDHELIMRITSPDISSKRGVFYTDLNGFHSVKRKRFKHFPRQANFYPMSSFAYIEDSVQRLSIISAQPLGISSQEDASLEVMLDRRLMYDDARGLGEGVRDTKITPSQFYLLLERKLEAYKETNIPLIQKDSENQDSISSFPSIQAHLLANHLQHHVMTMSVSSFSDGKPLEDMLEKQFKPLRDSLPCDIALLNLRAMGSGPQEMALPRRGAIQEVKAAMILHKFGVSCEFPSLGFQCDDQNRDVVLQNLFADAKISKVFEMTLSLMHELEEISVNASLKQEPMELYAYKLFFK